MFVVGANEIATVIETHRAEPTPKEALRLGGYVAALLADSPGDPELPIGSCSYDETPLLSALDFAQQAAADGALGRFLRLHLIVAGNHVNRVAWSSGGTAEMGTRSAGLEAAPIHTDAFLAGLCFHFEDGFVPRMGAFRLGRTIAESTVADRLKPWLRDRIADKALSDGDRLRMSWVLAGVLGREGDAEPPRGSDWRRPLADVARELRALDMPEIARWWVEGVAKE